jgi:tRNA(Leu) C34 or U34 (ribose-2'-O)-methylase TrmL
VVEEGISMTMQQIIGKNSKTIGVSPSIILSNPKYAHNVGHIVRAASCFGIKQVWYTGERVRLDIEKEGRLPREERMKGYKSVDLVNFDYPFDQFNDVTPVAIELRPNAENLLEFEHPENAVYVFGPEDGSIRQIERKHCHRFVYIPTHFCVNLSAAVYMVLWDRKTKRYMRGEEQSLHISEVLKEERSWAKMGLQSQGESV